MNQSPTHRRVTRVVAFGLAVFLPALWPAWGAEVPVAGVVARPPPPAYEVQTEHSPDGIGKFYQGREIAHFMSHLGAEWLERPEREEEERPGILIEALSLKPGMKVADIGAGSGYLTRRLAKVVGPSGVVFATDIQPEMIALLRTNLTEQGITNFIAVLSSPTDPKLPTNTLDLALLVDVYHECDYPYETIQGISRALKPGGRLVFVEYRGEDAWVPIKPLHKMTEAQVRREMTFHPLSWEKTLRVLPRQHIIIFRRDPDG